MSNTEYDLTKFDKVMSDIVGIQKQGDFVPDCTTTEGYEASKRFVFDVTTPARKMLETAHKDIKKPFLDACRFLDGKKKELMPLLEQIEKPHKDSYKAIDQAKKEKKEKFEADMQAKVQNLLDFRNRALNQNSETITNLIDELYYINTDVGFYNRKDDAIKARNESLEILNDALISTIKSEQEAKENAEMQKKLAEQQAIIDEQARKQKEIDDKAEAEENEKLRIENEERIAEQAAEEATQKEIAKQKQIADDIASALKQREENTRNVTRIRKQSKEALMKLGLSEDDSIKIVEAISNKEIPNIVINY